MLPTERLRGIYAIVDDASGRDSVALVDDVLAAGIRLVQYRAKRGVDRAVVRAMHERTAANGGLLIVNDDVEAALDADGLHVGQEDLAPVDRRALRERLRERVLGVSCGSAEEARDAEALGADYVGAGPYAKTASKLDAGTPLGATGLRAIVAGTYLPVAAIGGIELSDLAAIVAAGAQMAAVISAIARGPDPGANARALVESWARLTQ